MTRAVPGTCGILFAISCLGSPALAQESADGAPVADNHSDDIVVTARRREESLKDVPSSVTSIGAAQIEQSGAAKLSDVQFSVPNVYFGNPQNQTQTAITIRGVGDYSRNIGMDTRVSVYVDGIYVGNSLGLNQQLLDVERVEVLRGPQGTLFGRNTVAGAINLVTKRPDDVAAGQIGLSAGNFDMRKVSGDANIPLSDTVFVKVGGGYTKSARYVTNLFDGSKLGGGDSWGLRSQLRWLASEGLTIDLASDYGQADNDSFQKTSASLTALGPYQVNFDTPVFDRTRQWGASLRTTLEVGSGTLVGIAAYRWVRGIAQNDEDGSPLFIADSNFTTKSRQLTGEIRYESSPADRFRYIVGAYTEHGSAASFIGSTSPVLAPNIPGNLLVDDHGRSNQTNYAVFGNMEYDIAPSLTLEAGARFSLDRKKIDFTQFVTNPALGLVSFTKIDAFSDSSFTPSGSLKLRASETTNLYARLSKGYKSGGYNADVVSNSDIRFRPETVIAIEAGIKSELLDRKLRINAAVFQSRHTDYQVFQFITPIGSTSSILQLSNAGKARSRGFEIDAGLFLGDLTLNGGIGYADATFLSFPNCSAITSCEGQRLPGSPKWTGSASALYQFPLSRSIDTSMFAQYSHRSGTFTDVPNFATLQTQSIHLVNARVTFNHRDSGLSFYVFGDNLFDSHRIQSANSLFLGIPTRFYNMPRTYGAGASYKF